MAKPKGRLTGAQMGIVRLIWAHGSEGVTVGELWQQMNSGRTLARTTVQTMLTRLIRRGWLARKSVNGVHRYRAVCEPEEASAQMAAEFMDEYFEGSTEHLVMSLLNSKRITPNEVKRLRRLLNNNKESKK